MRSVSGDPARVRALYLDTLERVICNTIYRDPSVDAAGIEHPYDPALRAEGRDWPTRALTMVGLKRLHHVRECVETVVAEGVRGDLLEAGVWRGGASIMMRAVLAAYGADERRVWVADSFRGLPPPDTERYPLDADWKMDHLSVLAVPREEVQRNFASLGLLDDSVRFVEGWFSETLHAIEADAFAVIRLDGDLYESTMQSLEALYPRLTPGGFVIVDDYGAISASAAAVHDYRERYGVTEPIVTIDWTGVYWRKSP